MSMKIILRADVENLGVLGDVVTVKPGYARNYLLPQGLAMVANAGNLKTFELERKKLQAKMDALRQEARDTQGKLEALEIVIPMHVGENEKLYGSVTATIIGDAMADLGVEIDRRRILLDSPIKTLGRHLVRVRLHSDIIATVPVTVVSDQPREEPSPIDELNEEEKAALAVDEALLEAEEARIVAGVDE